jgi:hypothetical protein
VSESKAILPAYFDCRASEGVVLALAEATASTYHSKQYRLKQKDYSKIQSYLTGMHGAWHCSTGMIVENPVRSKAILPGCSDYRASDGVVLALATLATGRRYCTLVRG